MPGKRLHCKLCKEPKHLGNFFNLFSIYNNVNFTLLARIHIVKLEKFRVETRAFLDRKVFSNDRKIRRIWQSDYAEPNFSTRAALPSSTIDSPKAITFSRTMQCASREECELINNRFEMQTFERQQN